MSNAFKCDFDILTANDDGIRQTPPRVIFIHTFEGRDLDAAEMARYQLSPAAGGSYTIVIDVDGKTARENDDEFIPWSAGPTANRAGHHISLAGQAAFSRDTWLSRTKQIDKLIEVIAAYCRQYGYPPVIRVAGELAAGKWGMSTHAEASKAWRETDHTDPGVNFPLDVVRDRVAKALNSTPKPKPLPAPRIDPSPIAPGNKYPSYLDARELRFSEYLRFIDEKITRLYDARFPDGGAPLAVDINDGKIGPTYHSYADNSKAFTLDQFLRLIDWKVDQIVRKELP